MHGAGDKSSILRCQDHLATWAHMTMHAALQLNGVVSFQGKTGRFPREQRLASPCAPAAAILQGAVSAPSLS